MKLQISGKKTGIKSKRKKEEETKEPQYYRSITGDQMINYHVYYMSTVEKILYFLVGFIAGAAVGFIFYGDIGLDEYGERTLITHILNTVILFSCGFLCGKMYLPIRQEQILKARQKKLRSQFRDMLEAMSTSLGSGKNVTESFKAVYEDLQNQYDENTFILQELKTINTGINNGINPEELLLDFGKRGAIIDIEDFAGVFEICYRRGGNIKDTIQNTCNILTEKMNIEEEIETTVSGSKNEQYIMLVIPIALIAMIKLSSPEFAANFTTLTGLISTTVAIAFFIASYYLGRKLLTIKV